MSALELKVDWSRGGFTLKVDLSVPAQGVTALFGPSGSGKTTLLRVVAGLEHVRARVVLAGSPWQDETRFLPPHRRPVGVVFQEASLFPHLSVRANLEYGWKRVPASERTLNRDDVIGWLGLEKLTERAPHQLSGGQRQRVAIGRALLSCPRLLLMDEPMAALDAQAHAEILPCLERLHRELSLPVLYVSHALDEVARLADHLLLIDNGRIAYQGSPAEGLTRLDLPLAHRDVAATVLDAVVVRQDAELQLTRVAGGGIELELAGLHGRPGGPLRVRVAARDVSLALAMPQQTSILNLLPARVVELAEDVPGQVLVKLALGEMQLLARITRKSARQLKLEPGTPVIAQVKSVAVA